MVIYSWLRPLWHASFLLAMLAGISPAIRLRIIDIMTKIMAGSLGRVAQKSLILPRFWTIFDRGTVYKLGCDYPNETG